MSETKSQFDTLLAQLEAEQKEQATMVKSIQDAGKDGDDTKIQAAAAEAGAEEEDKDKKKDGENTMTKSLMIGDEKYEILDPALMIKSLTELGERVGASESVLAKGLTSALAMIKGQGEMIKSLSEQVTKLSAAGTGRKAVLSIVEKQPVDAGTGGEKGITTAEFMAKSHSAFAAKKITGQELTVIDVSIRQGAPIEQSLMTKVLSAS